MLSLSAFTLLAQNFTRSYGAVSCCSSTGTMMAAPSGMAAYADFYDDYVMWNGMTKFVFDGTNADGSLRFYPVRKGPTALSTIGLLFSRDYKNVREVQQSSMMGMTIQIWYDYQYLGEGSHAALNLMGTTPDYGDTDEPIQCHSCMGSGSCRYCNGTGRNEYTRDGRCGVCRGSRKCAGCNGKGTY